MILSDGHSTHTQTAIAQTAGQTAPVRRLTANASTPRQAVAVIEYKNCSAAIPCQRYAQYPIAWLSHAKSKNRTPLESGINGSVGGIFAPLSTINRP